MDTIAHYRITGELGAGGMGVVYRARDTKLERDVAIKVLPEELSRDEERLARFEREARLLAQLNHPNIATLYGFEKDGSRQFLVMELVEGETLAELARPLRPLTPTAPAARRMARWCTPTTARARILKNLNP